MYKKLTLTCASKACCPSHLIDNVFVWDGASSHRFWGGASLTVVSKRLRLPVIEIQVLARPQLHNASIVHIQNCPYGSLSHKYSLRFMMCNCVHINTCTKKIVLVFPLTLGLKIVTWKTTLKLDCRHMWGLNFPGYPLLMDVIKHIVVFDHSSTEKCLDMRCFIFKISGPSLDVISWRQLCRYL